MTITNSSFSAQSSNGMLKVPMEQAGPNNNNSDQLDNVGTLDTPSAGMSDDLGTPARTPVIGTEKAFSNPLGADVLK